MEDVSPNSGSPASAIIIGSSTPDTNDNVAPDGLADTSTTDEDEEEANHMTESERFLRYARNGDTENLAKILSHKDPSARQTLVNCKGVEDITTLND